MPANIRWDLIQRLRR